MAYLSWLLMWFEAISGLRINLDKSEFCRWGEVENLEVLALEVGCKVGRLPTSYLGLPLGAHHKSVVVWDGVEESFRKRLAMWKGQFISKGGRITLIQSTLSNMPIYLMPLLRIPRVGGLGVRRLSTLNRPCYVSGTGALRMKERLFGGMSLVGSLGRKKGVGILEKLGRVLSRLMEGNKEGRVSFAKQSCISVGDGRKRLWLVELWDSLGEEGVWSPRFSRPFNDWEVEEVERLLLTIRGRRLNPHWKIECCGRD
ncbi:hypothetical protein CK203_039501 [Vitis vinifera]|uniref:Uncharacterized protein n=1 Tax=Vitis vinifera TaxID=29760 RepID=A0A438HKK1_VITVI|nr:hypothetical protein CK203_039501 [Vitis vinifera]